jgi:hypothetical protein
VLKGLLAGLTVAFVACSSSSTNDNPGNTGGTGGGTGGGAGVCNTTTHSCQPEPPAGWKAVHVVPGDNSEGCTDPVMGGTAVTADAFTCPGCSCGAISGGACATSASVTYTRGASSCAPGCPKAVDTPVDGTCANVPVVCSSPATTNPNGITVPPVPITQGNCEPDSVVPPVLPTPDVSDLQTLCTPAVFAANCGAGQVCFENPPAGAVPRYCVASETAGPCPIEYPHERATIYTGVSDTRGCTECGCDLSGLSCEVSVTNYMAEGCPAGTGFTSPITAGQCTGMSNWESIQLQASVPATMQCNPVGGQPTGELSLTNETKICCTLP